MKKILVLLFTVASTIAFATRQRPDTVRIDGNLYLMHVSLLYNNPVLEYYLVKKKKDPFHSISPTNCYRAHIASYLIQHDSIFIDRISDPGTRYRDSIDQQTRQPIVVYKWYDLDTLFSVDRVHNKVFADWFTGYLRVETLHYERRRKHPCDTTSVITYESDEYIILRVLNGKIVTKANFDNFSFWALQWKCDSNIQPADKKLYEDYDRWADRKSRKRKYWTKA